MDAAGSSASGTHGRNGPRNAPRRAAWRFGGDDGAWPRRRVAASADAGCSADARWRWRDLGAGKHRRTSGLCRPVRAAPSGAGGAETHAATDAGARLRPIDADSEQWQWRDHRGRSRPCGAAPDSRNGLVRQFGNGYRRSISGWKGSREAAGNAGSGSDKCHRGRHCNS